MKNNLAPTRCAGFAMCAALVAGCASTHDYSKDGVSLFGGGFRSTEMLPGFHYIKARSNLALIVSHEAATRTWRQRADEVCKPAGYQELRIREFVEDISEPLKTGHPLAAREGYALCKNARTTYEAAIERLEGR